MSEKRKKKTSAEVELALRNYLLSPDTENQLLLWGGLLLIILAILAAGYLIFFIITKSDIKIELSEFYVLYIFVWMVIIFIGYFVREKEVQGTGFFSSDSAVTSQEVQQAAMAVGCLFFIPNIIIGYVEELIKRQEYSDKELKIASRIISALNNEGELPVERLKDILATCGNFTIEEISKAGTMLMNKGIIEVNFQTFNNERTRIARLTKLGENLFSVKIKKG